MKKDDKPRRLNVNQDDPAEYRSASGAVKEIKRGNGYRINKDGSISFGEEALK